MNKFSGYIGYAKQVETAPGVWEEQITEYKHTGDLVRPFGSRMATSEELNDNLNVSTQISIMANPYANNHFTSMRYVKFMGAKWKISNVEPKYPRLLLTIGGLYNGN